jgi:hypothetical protein
VKDLWTGFIWLEIGTSGRFLDWIDVTQDRNQWQICGLD